jgi:hypothetical protein
VEKNFRDSGQVVKEFWVCGKPGKGSAVKRVSRGANIIIIIFCDFRQFCGEKVAV